MRVHAPSSNAKIWWTIRSSDALSVCLAAPVAAVLRDPSLFSDEHLYPTLIYCSIGLIAGLAMLLIFHLAKSLSDPVSLREIESFAVVSMATTALTAVMVFSYNRLDSVPRSMPVIQFLVLIVFLSTGRVIARKWRQIGSRHGHVARTSSQHVLVIGANRLTWSYLRMLDALQTEHSNIAAILDDDPKMLGRALFGYSIVAPPSEYERVLSEYRVHGVNIDHILVASNRPTKPSTLLTQIEQFCQESGITLEFLADILGIRLDAISARDPAIEASAAPGRAFLILKRVFDFSISLAISVVFLPIVVAVLFAVLIDLGRPVMFWQKRLGYRERPFLIYKFRTRRAPFDRRGEFVPEDQRASRVGDLLRRTRLDELPQLWNVLMGDMSFVGPRPLLPVDQPPNSKLRLTVKPGITGWAQIRGGARLGVEEKGEFDDWYVNHASFGLDLWIIARTIQSVIFGDKVTTVPQPPTVPARSQHLSHSAEREDSLSNVDALVTERVRELVNRFSAPAEREGGLCAVGRAEGAGVRAPRTIR
jgi:lipopolysaccharide/colanic/teichoic acid biosynthesis glycosyltransferase